MVLDYSDFEEATSQAGQADVGLVRIGRCKTWTFRSRYDYGEFRGKLSWARLRVVKNVDSAQAGERPRLASRMAPSWRWW